VSSAEQLSKARRGQPDALRVELECARAEFERAERKARTYLAERGILDQTRIDLAATLDHIARRDP